MPRQQQIRQTQAEKFDRIVCSQVLRATQEAEYYISADNNPNETMTREASFGVSYNTIGYTPFDAASDQISEFLITIDKQFDRLEFESHYAQWRATRNRISSMAGDITRNPHYFRIVGMGSRALPSILSHLYQEVRLGTIDHWFPALWAITGTNPVPPGSEGRMREMAEAWIEWGRQEGHLNDETLGEGFSQSRRLERK